ncbi:MAG: c-type cytochrome [Gammaproteobacteria bacterium]
MKNVIVVVAVACLSVPATGDTQDWAYQVVENIPPSEIDIHAPRTVPGSTRSYTQQEIDDDWNPPDWFPDDHAPLPQAVAHGPEEVRGCAACHLTSGMGHPESAQLAGLPVEYFMRQMVDFRSGARKDRYWMNGFAQALSDEDAREVAEYYAAIEPIDWVELVEADTVPRSYIGDGRMRFRHPDGGTEPLGRRIIELPQDQELVTAKHPYSGFIAYVPVGSVARGEELVTTGGAGKTIACNICHGVDLKGLGEVPAIVGISPLYTVRQLNDIQIGDRAGTWTALMQATVVSLTEDDMIAIAAYLASLDP